MTCEICGKEARWSWTDTHGIAQCIECGTAYRIYHYENDKRVNKPPELSVKQEYVPLVKAYWEKHHRRMPSGCSFPGGQELASQDDAEAFYAWLDANLPTEALTPKTK